MGEENKRHCGRPQLSATGRHRNDKVKAGSQRSNPTEKDGGRLRGEGSVVIVQIQTEKEEPEWMCRPQERTMVARKYEKRYVGTRSQGSAKALGSIIC